MFKKSKILFLIMALMLVTVAFTGCKSNKSDSSKTTTKEDKIAVGAATFTPTPSMKPIDYTKATIKDVYAKDFKVGTILGGSTVYDENCLKIVKDNFNSVTCENEMKPDSLLDRETSISDPKYDEAPAVTFRNADDILKFCKENGIQMRGHTLVWFAQTPQWFFSEGYSDDPNAKLVSKEKMLKRMENYIKAVMEYANTNYPGVIYAWDVVNEAVEVGNKQKDGLRTKDNFWYKIIGPEYIDKAFEFARKYAAKDQKLFYNDYSTDNPTKQMYITNLLTKLKKEGNIDGLGMQTHINMTSPTLTQLDQSVRDYSKLGIELQVTELDMALNSDKKADLEKQAVRYKRLFLYFKNWKNQGIKLTGVTFWGITDDMSWLNNLLGDTEYPLLFDYNYKKKPAFYGVIQDPKIPLY